MSQLNDLKKVVVQRVNDALLSESEAAQLLVNILDAFEKDEMTYSEAYEYLFLK